MKLTLNIVSFCLLAGGLCAADYYVDAMSAAGGDGSAQRPFKALSELTDVLKPGDVCYVREGSYEEPLVLDGLKGTKDAPIRIIAAEGASVRLDGTRSIEAEWSKVKDGIYQAKLGYDVWQLFDGSRLLDLARWPNASVNDGSVWDPHVSMRATDRNWINKLGRSDSVTQSGIILDQNHKDAHDNVNTQTLAETGIDFTGAIAVLNIGHWLTWTRPILTHEAGSNEFTYDDAKTRMLKFLEYYIYGLQALDRANEWWFDVESKTLYLKPADGIHPDELELRGKVRDYNLRVQDCDYIEFDGIDFFATTFGINESSNILINDSQLLYPSTNKFVLGVYSWVNEKQAFAADNNLTFIRNTGEGPHNNWVRNSSIEWPNSPAISLESAGSGLDNCYLHSIAWDVNASGGSGSLPGGAGVTVRNCTIHTTGNSEGVRLGKKATIEGNRIYNTSLLQHDGSAINIGTPSQPGTVARRNWVYNTNRQAIRYDSTTSDFGTNAAVVENVFFDVQGGSGGNKFKGDYQLVAKNTAFDCFVAIPKGWGDTAIHNEHSLVRNNLADFLVEWNLRDRIDGITAKMDHNVHGEGSVRRLLRDPDNFDFRPRADAKELINAGQLVRREELLGEEIRLPDQPFEGSAPDIGAYEYGADYYWIPGCRFEIASGAVPANGATNVKTDVDLMWLAGRDAVVHHVYFADSRELLRDKVVPARFCIARDLPVSRNSATPSGLVRGKTYYWRVDVVEADGVLREGEVWSFQVQ